MAVLPSLYISRHLFPLGINHAALWARNAQGDADMLSAYSMSCKLV